MNCEERPLKDVIAGIRAALAPKYGEGEARAMGRIIFENLKGWTPVDLAIRQDEPISAFIQGKVDEVVKRLLKDEPIQQIFGVADFYGMKLKVTPETLIPRPETEELVDLIVKENQHKDLRVLDCGTGSGCIAIALQRNLPFSEVTAIDVSEKALEVARENGKILHAPVEFLNADILKLPSSLNGSSYDIIVSNPPYIAMKERASMEPNVVDYEPATALFVPDNDPLLFYRAILNAATGELLAPQGKIYFEINPLYANELVELATQYGFDDARLVRDTEGKNRFLLATESRD